MAEPLSIADTPTRTCVMQQPPPPGPVELGARERKYITVLSFGLGICQGCGLCFYVGAGAYFAAIFDDNRFFVKACAFFYLPPMLITVLQLLLDRRFDVLLGIRSVIVFRIFFSSGMVVLLLASFCWVCHPHAYPGERSLVYGLGTALGMFAASLLGSACLLFGAVDPRFVPYLVLGQTFAGVYTNAAAWVLGFKPGCALANARAYFGLAAASVVVGMVAYLFYNHWKLLERTYQYHETLLVYQQTFSSCSVGAQLEEGVAPRRRRTAFGFPLLCWSMVLCQALAIAMNMSLTPLANQVAHGSYALAQELVLVKLLADFVGRVVFLAVIPKPKSIRILRWRVDGVKVHAIVVWLIELARAPIWTLVYMWAHNSERCAFLANSNLLLWVVWLPLISTGAMSSSWCFVIAVTAAPEAKRPEVNLLMSFSVYAGFASGILVALFSR